ncbi:MAG: hypothetical protein JWP29_550 [Rhodoferax sp.]|nr:hypothetical protein [Rhodoferax sp.]
MSDIKANATRPQKAMSRQAAAAKAPVDGMADEALPDASLLDGLQISKDSRTLGANVTNALRNAIIQGKLPPGQALGQEYLATLFGVSRVPIRECLKQLASEGLVEVEPHRGAVVAHLSVDELDELYGIIWSLETLAVREGVPRLTDADLAGMAAILKNLDTIDDPVLWYRTSTAFHRQILVATGWQRCLRIVDECRRNIGRYVMEQSFFAAHVGEWRSRNRALFRACQKRDVEAAVEALDVMRRLSTAQIREHLKTSLDAPAAPTRAAVPPPGRSRGH